MTPAGLITRLEGHHSRTNMLSTAELYNLLPAILSALRGMEAARTVDEIEDEASYLLQQIEGHCTVLGETGPAHAIEGTRLRVKVQAYLKRRDLKPIYPQGFAALSQEEKVRT